MPASSLRRVASAPAQLRSAATDGSWTTRRCLTTQASGWSARPGTARWKRVLSSGTPARAPRRRSRFSAKRDDYLTEVLAELDRAASAEKAPRSSGPAALERVVLDRRGESPLAVLADAAVGGGDVLAVCADVPRRIDGLRERVGGLTLISYAALERDPFLAESYRQLVALDPPTSDIASGVLRAGCGFAHLAWGEPELRFAEQMHESEYGLRTSLVAVYRGLRLRHRVAGEELERLLRGDGPHGRSARLAARIIRVLAELELVSLDRDLPALAIASESQTALERSAAYRAYAARYEDGRRFLSSLTPRPSA